SHISRQQIEVLRLTEQYELWHFNHGSLISRGCLERCCWTTSNLTWFTPDKHRILRRLSPIDVKLIADLHYGTLQVPDGFKLPKLTKELIPCIQPGTVFFVDSPDIEVFLKDYHQNIKVDYILITGDSDISVPTNLESKTGITTSLIENILDGKTHILHWFAMNCDLGSKRHKKTQHFTCIPNGISQWENQRYNMEIAATLKYSKSNDYLLLASFSPASNEKIRKPLWDLACNQDALKNITKCFYERNKSLLNFYQDIAQSLDCYRTWESLYLNSIPIVQSSSLDSIYDQLPVLIVKNYSSTHLNREYLNQIYNQMTTQTYDLSRLYKDYWQQKIQSYKPTSNISMNVRIRYYTIKV
ncbi:unnamed protein product, partial [Didymodactylos carnosus]